MLTTEQVDYLNKLFGLEEADCIINDHDETSSSHKENAKMTTNIKWTTSNLTLLGKYFLRQVLANMREQKGAQVRLGETGKGIQPNYQVTFTPERVNIIRGSSHKIYEREDIDSFYAENISDPFTYQDIENAIARCA